MSTPARSIAPPAVPFGSLKVSPCNVGVHPLARPDADRPAQEHREHPQTIRPARAIAVVDGFSGRIGDSVSARSEGGLSGWEGCL
jgi:hypothetical protein